MATSLTRPFARNGAQSGADEEKSFVIWKEVDKVFDNISRAFESAPQEGGKQGFAQAALDGKMGDADEAEPATQIEVMRPQALNAAKPKRLSPLADALENDEGFEVTVELPGVDPEDIELKFLRTSLSVVAERRKKDPGEGAGKYHLRERVLGTYERHFDLPFPANPDTITAVCEDGVVRIYVPHPPETKPREKIIEVRRANGRAN